MESENDTLVGRQLGMYQIQAQIGLGGMARVYKAYHPRLRREVAIKVILPSVADTPGFRERFEREAQLSASLEHPNIVSVYDFGEEGDLTYLVMQYVGGGTLRSKLGPRKLMSPQQTVLSISQMARALHHAHQRGIIHRDVKPQNMLLSSTDPNHLLLSDFGIAKLTYQGSEDALLPGMPTRNVSSAELTSASQIIGTADYMAPEQAKGQEVDARTDVYALGVVLYQMLSGEIPFRSTTLHGLLFQHIYTPPPSIRMQNPHVPEILDQITLKALAKDPADRFQSAEALARALEQANMYATQLHAFPTSSAPGIYSPPIAPAHAVSNAVAPPLSAGSQTEWRQPTSGDYADREAVTAISRSQQAAQNERFTSAPGIQRPGSEITGIPPRQSAPRRIQFSYIIAAVLIVACLAVLGLRFLPGLTNSGTGKIPGSSFSVTTTTGGASNLATAFHEAFQNNNLNWQTGSLISGVEASTPSGGSYSVTITQNATAFPYPQGVGLLPDDFTFAATLQQTAGAPTVGYGLAFHFTQDSSGAVNSYALIVNKSGAEELLEYTQSQAKVIANGNYPSSKAVHTLTVQARGSTYTFSIDGKAIYVLNGSASWTNNDLHSGHPALFFSSNGGSSATFKATDVQLSIP